MTREEILEYIQTYITVHGGRQLSAARLRTVLEAMLDQPNIVGQAVNVYYDNGGSELVTADDVQAAIDQLIGILGVLIPLVNGHTEDIEALQVANVFTYPADAGVTVADIGKLASMRDDGSVGPYAYDTLVAVAPQGELSVSTWQEGVQAVGDIVAVNAASDVFPNGMTLDITGPITLPPVTLKTVVADADAEILIGVDANATLANILAFFASPTNVWADYLEIYGSNNNGGQLNIGFRLKPFDFESTGEQGNNWTVGSSDDPTSPHQFYSGYTADTVTIIDAINEVTTVITAGVEVPGNVDEVAAAEAIAVWINANLSPPWTASTYEDTNILRILRDVAVYDPDSRLNYRDQENPFVVFGRPDTAIPARPVFGQIVSVVGEEEVVVGVVFEGQFELAVIDQGADSGVLWPGYNVFASNGGVGVVSESQIFKAQQEGSLWLGTDPDMLVFRQSNAAAGVAALTAAIGESTTVVRK